MLYALCGFAIAASLLLVKSEALCVFLKEHSSEEFYLVGDIIDGWRLRKKWYWPQVHTNVIRRILTAAKRGTV